MKRIKEGENSFLYCSLGNHVLKLLLFEVEMYLLGLMTGTVAIMIGTEPF